MCNVKFYALRARSRRRRYLGTLKYYYNHVKDNFINLRQVERHVYLKFIDGPNSFFL